MHSLHITYGFGMALQAHFMDGRRATWWTSARLNALPKSQIFNWIGRARTGREGRNETINDTYVTETNRNEGRTETNRNEPKEE